MRTKFSHGLYKREWNIFYFIFSSRNCTSCFYFYFFLFWPFLLEISHGRLFLLLEFYWNFQQSKKIRYYGLLIFFFFNFHFVQFRTWARFFIEGFGSGIAAQGNTNANDLLHEIDTALKIGKGFLLGEGASCFNVCIVFNLASSLCSTDRDRVSLDKNSKFTLLTKKTKKLLQIYYFQYLMEIFEISFLFSTRKFERGLSLNFFNYPKI